MILIHDTAHRGHRRQGWLDSQVQVPEPVTIE